MSDSPMRFPASAVGDAEVVLGGGEPGTERSAVTVLHLDADADRLALGARDPFEEHGLTVETAPTAVDAIELLGTGTVDCIVSEYELPETTGLAVLDRIRAAGYGVPFVLFTERAPESFAREAVSADVSEFVRKGVPGQYATLAEAVDAVGPRRRGLSGESPPTQFERLRTLFEPLLCDSEVYVWDWNVETGAVTRYPETERLFGVDRAELEPVFDGFLDHVHPDHRETVRSTLEWALEHDSSYRMQYAVETDDRHPTWIQEHGVVVTEDGVPTHVVGINRDVTDQKTHERNLRWERELNRTFREALVESQTRSELESTVVEQLSAYGFDLVWIGDWLTDELKPRAVAGDEDRIRALGLDSSVDVRESRPSVTAARTGEPQFVTDAAGDSDWNPAESGFAAALPFVYNDVFYGVLTLYDRDAGSFTDAARKHLTELADTLAVVIHNVETGNALATNRTIHAKLQTVRADYYLRDLLRGADCDTQSVRIKVHETISRSGDQEVQYVSVNGAAAETIATAATADPRVEEVTEITDGKESQLQLVHTADTPEGILTSLGAGVRSVSVTSDRTDLLVEVPNRNALQSSIEALEASNENVSVLSCTERERHPDEDDSGPLAELTERQVTVLQAAYRQGYFEQPRGASATEVAESLDISHPTLLEHLRRAQEKIFRAHFPRS